MTVTITAVYVHGTTTTVIDTTGQAHTVPPEGLPVRVLAPLQLPDLKTKLLPGSAAQTLFPLRRPIPEYILAVPPPPPSLVQPDAGPGQYGYVWNPGSTDWEYTTQADLLTAAGIPTTNDGADPPPTGYVKTPRVWAATPGTTAADGDPNLANVTAFPSSS